MTRFVVGCLLKSDRKQYTCTCAGLHVPADCLLELNALFFFFFTSEHNSDTGAYLCVGLHRYNTIHVHVDSGALFAMHALAPESYHFGPEMTQR